MRLPTKPRQLPTSTPTFPSFFDSSMQVAITSLLRRFAAHDFQQAHHIRRAEEVVADHRLRPRRGGRDFVDIQRGSVAGENRTRLANAIEFGEHFLLQRHALEHRFDDDVRFRKAIVS